MNRRIKAIAWVCLAISLLLSVTGFLIRFENEKNNKAVLLVADYFEFSSEADKAHTDFKNILKELKASGVSTLALRETTPEGFTFSDIQGDANKGKSFGFDENIIKEIRELGFNVLLRPRNSLNADINYINEYEKIIKENNIKNLIFDGSELPGYPDNLQEIIKIINKYNIIVGGIENQAQVDIIRQKGINQIIKGTDYSINRAYITPEKDLVKLEPKDLYFRWMRCVVERNIRYIYVSPLKSPQIAVAENITSTISTVGRINDYIKQQGYSASRQPSKLSSQMPIELHSGALAASLIFALLLYLMYFVNPSKNTLISVFSISVLFFLFLFIFFSTQKLLYIALFAAIIYPSFSGLLLINYLKSKPSANFIGMLVKCLFLIIGVNAIGMYTISGALWERKNILGMEVYEGVIVSFVLPIVFFVLNYLVYYERIGNIKKWIHKLVSFKMTLSSTVIFLISILSIYIYLSRSGNDGLLSATKLELQIRMLLEKYLIARPRFKEVIIGYPALFSLSYLYYRYKKPRIILILGIGTVIGSISMVNSFCHVFTPILISTRRTFNGLILGIVSGTLCIMTIYCMEIIFEKYKQKNLENIIVKRIKK